MESITVQLKLLFVAGPAYRIVGEAGQMSRYDSGQETERLLYRFFYCEIEWNVTMTDGKLNAVDPMIRVNPFLKNNETDESLT